MTGSIHASGGGPNRRYRIVLQASDGSLLLAVNQAPDGWQVEQGKPEGGQDAGSYYERHFGVRFVHGGRTVELASGRWGRTASSGCAYLLWGSAAQRELRPGKGAPLDYVGGWVDLAIVRAR